VSSKVVITGIDTNSLPKLSGKEQAELMIKIKQNNKIVLFILFSFYFNYYFTEALTNS
jgi:hypothetical protein